MPRMETPAMVLQQMQVLDQQVAPPFAVAEQRLHFGERSRVDLPPFRVIGPASASRAGMDPAVVCWGISHFTPATSPSTAPREREGPSRQRREGEGVARAPPSPTQP